MKRNIYQTATLVTVLSVMERTLGFLYRIVLSRLIGAEGLGIYQVALSVFSVFVTIGSGGIPVTVSRLISKSKAEENGKSENTIATSGVFFCLCLTLPVCLGFFLFKNAFDFLFSDPRSEYVFGILLLGLCCTCLYAVLRGRFWGNKKFLLTSTVEILEEGVMVIVGILLLRGACSPFDGAKKAAVAVVISYLVSFSVTLVFYFLHKGRFCSPFGKLKPLISSALPITAVRTGGTLISSAVAVLLPAMLIKNGYSSADALAVFGVVSGMVMPVLSTPSTLIGSISLVLVPELAEDYYKKDEKRLTHNVERGIFLSLLIACALTPFFSALGGDLGKALFSNALAGEMIERFCFMLIPMSISIITTGILNSLNFEKQTLAHYFIGAATMLFCVLFLPHKLGANAYPTGLTTSFILTALLNLNLLRKTIRFSAAFIKKCLFVFALVLPLSLVGKFVYLPCSIFFGVGLGITFTAIIMLVFTILLYTLCQIPIFFSFQKIFSKK